MCFLKKRGLKVEIGSSCLCVEAVGFQVLLCDSAGNNACTHSPRPFQQSSYGSSTLITPQLDGI